MKEMIQLSAEEMEQVNGGFGNILFSLVKNGLDLAGMLRKKATEKGKSKAVKKPNRPGVKPLV